MNQTTSDNNKIQRQKQTQYIHQTVTHEENLYQ